MLIIKKDILILGKGSTQGLENTTLKEEAKYPINLQNQEVCTIMEATVSYLLMLQKSVNSKEKIQKQNISIMFR